MRRLLLLVALLQLGRAEDDEEEFCEPDSEDLTGGWGPAPDAAASDALSACGFKVLESLADVPPGGGDQPLLVRNVDVSAYRRKWTRGLLSASTEEMQVRARTVPAHLLLFAAARPTTR